MTIEEALYSYLSGYAGLSALIGNRIYPLVLPQNPTLPAVTHSKVSRTWQYVLGGNGPKITRPRMQFSCWGSTFGSAKAVADQVIAALGNFSGTMGGAGGVNVLATDLANELQFYEPDTQLYHVPVDVFIYHE